jgi:two-component system response regulator AlgR
MRVLIVDDEQPARERVRELLKDMPEMQVVGSASNGEAAFALCLEKRPDVLITDIRMPGMNGLELARHINLLEAPPAIVFLTAFDDQAMAAFDLHAVDYLLKPVRSERLLQALSRARRFGQLPESISRGSGPRSHLCARLGGALKLVPVTDILYLLADTKYVQVVSRGGQVLIEDSLVQLESEFSNHFVRIHRNCLVAIKEIAGIERDSEGSSFITLKSATAKLEVSRRNLSQVRDFLRQL